MHLNITNPTSIRGWLKAKGELHKNLRPYLSYTDDLVVIDGVIMKGRCINHTSSAKTTSVGSTQSKSYGYGKNKSTHMQMHILG